jgi:hypothetical protein
MKLENSTRTKMLSVLERNWDYKNKESRGAAFRREFADFLQTTAKPAMQEIGELLNENHFIYRIVQLGHLTPNGLPEIRFSFREKGECGKLSFSESPQLALRCDLDKEKVRFRAYTARPNAAGETKEIGAYYLPEITRRSIQDAIADVLSEAYGESVGQRSDLVRTRVGG